MFGLNSALRAAVPSSLRLGRGPRGAIRRGRLSCTIMSGGQDDGFKVLELILTAPVVVASWISLQYFGSAVAPQLFGAGNKLLHNVVGGIGVVEGNGGNLRTGLPWQSVHDGEPFVHEPLRLTVAVEAPKEAITDILRRHAHVRALFDNGWLSLFTLDQDGRMAWRYQPGPWLGGSHGDHVFADREQASRLRVKKRGADPTAHLHFFICILILSSLPPLRLLLLKAPHYRAGGRRSACRSPAPACLRRTGYPPLSAPFSIRR